MAVPTAPNYEGVLLPGSGGIRIPTEVYGSVPGGPGGTMRLVKQVTHSYASSSANWAMTADETAGSEYVVTNASGAANATFPAAFPGKVFTVYNNSGQVITFLVSGQTGVAVANGARAVLVCESTDIARVTGDQTANGSISPAPIGAGATLAVTPANNGATILLNQAAGSVVTLPAATGSGNKYLFVVTVTTSSNKDAILAASVSDFIQGISIGENAGTTKAFTSNATTNHSIQMPFAGSQPSGGFIGDRFELQDIAANLWQATGFYQAGTTPTTPFASATT